MCPASATAIVALAIMGPNTSYRKKRYPDRDASRNVTRIPYARTLMFPPSQMAVGMPRYRRQPAQQMIGRENMDWAAIHAQATANMPKLDCSMRTAMQTSTADSVTSTPWRGGVSVSCRGRSTMYGGHRCVCRHRWAYHLHADFRSAYRIPPAG